MEQSLIAAAETFLKNTFAASAWAQANAADAAYRIQHSYRVANLCKRIALSEGFCVTDAVISGLLHDIAYAEGIDSEAAWRNHGRRSAAMVRPFLTDLGLEERRIQAICYGIAIHVDDTADFEFERTPFCETVGDADNIDRFDAYRIYEMLEHRRYSKLPSSEQQDITESTLQRLEQLRQVTPATETAAALWMERLDFYQAFFEHLQAQLKQSAEIQ